MKVSCLFVMLVFLTPVALAQAARVPYVFEMNDGKAVHGLVDPEDLERGISVDVIVEKPWNREVYTKKLYKREYKDAYPEASVSRKVRIDNAWEETGKGVQIETASGTQWVFKTDLALAERALAAEQTAAQVDPSEMKTVASVDATPMQVESGGGLGQWWLHGVIVLGTLFFGALIVWWGFIRRSWSSL